MKTTLNAIRAHRPCQSGWEKLLRYLGKTKADDELLEILTILESNGIDDALWCLRAVDGHENEIRKLACDYALSVAHFWGMPNVVREYLETQDERLRAAAGEATWEAAWEAAWAAARDAAWEAAWAAARDATWEAAWAAARKTQEEMLRAALAKVTGDQQP